MSQTIYLDNAATTPLSEQVLEEMMPYLKDSYGNPSSVYDLGVANKSALLTARKRIAKTLNCANPQNIYFTSGGTESDNWAIIGTAEQCKKNGNHIITSKIEHHAVLNTCAYLEERGFEITYLDVDEQGFIKPEKLLQALRKDTILVSIMTANNEIGTIQAIPELASLVKANSRAVFHTDAVQAYGQIPIDITKMNVDLLSASAHKFYGPKGAGFLYIREGVNLPSFHHGGKQESGLRAGTENVPALVGMGKAAQLVNEILMEKSNMMSQLRDYMIHRIEQEIPYCHLNGSRRKRLPNNINISFSFVDGETIVILLDMEGICVSAGSACNAGQSITSHVIEAIGLTGSLARGTVRFTLSSHTTKEEIDRTVDALKEIIEKNKTPIVVGGTGLYVNSLIYGIDYPEVETDLEYRKELEKVAEQKGLGYLYEEAKKIDPEAVKNISVNDKKRIIRILEIYKETGKTKTQLEIESRKNGVPYDYRVFAINMPREILYDRINRRVDIMLEKGLIEEVKQLYKKYGDELRTSVQGIGYKEVIDYLNGMYSKEEMIEKIKMETRRYAKRQLTWFRKIPNIIWIDGLGNVQDNVNLILQEAELNEN